ncbi:MAG TPA: M14 family zinc carboxypeptidase, partial [Thermomicrobiales bacterium]|nr:M14 family zinc carboxypeptidase [Thermomicrobiales bacterium]
MHGRAWAGVACAGLWASLGWLNGAQAAETWRTLTRSVEDRVIEYCRFGQGERQVLVVAPLAGDEVEGVELAERLASHLEQFPRRLTDTAVTIVRDPNPDGRFRRSPGNAHGVLLDRNFRTRHWRKIPQGDRWLSGREPESEPETRAAADLLEDLKPQRIVILGSSRHTGVLNYAGPAEQIAVQVARLAGMRPLPLDSIDAAGAFAAYAGVDRGIATLVLRVPVRSTAAGNWSRYKRALLAAIDMQGEAAEVANEAAAIPGEAAAIPAEAPSADAQLSVSSAPPGGDFDEPRRLTSPATAVALQSPGKRKSASRAEEPDLRPRVLSAKDLEHGGHVVPLGRPPIAAAPSPAPPRHSASAPKAAASRPARPSLLDQLSGARLYDPAPSRPNAAAPSSFPRIPLLAAPT